MNNKSFFFFFSPTKDTLLQSAAAAPRSARAKAVPRRNGSNSNAHVLCVEEVNVYFMNQVPFIFTLLKKDPMFSVCNFLLSFSILVILPDLV